ncbi:MAG: restriction endonuclease subunit R, partial [Arenibacter sp.]
CLVYNSYGYIVDYMDLFDSVKKSINDYTSGAFDEYDADDVKGLLSDRYEVSKERLETALEKVRALCEPVFPKDDIHFIRYFCGNPEKSSDIKDTEEKRVNLYKAVASLVRAYTDIANELHKIGYSPLDAKELKEEVIFYKDLKETIKRASGDYVDLKRFEPGMRLLMDMYLDASSSKKISDFENRTLVDIIVNAMNEPEAGYGKKNEAVAETIENNVRRKIVEQFQTNPKYYERMSHLLDELIQQRRKEALAYQEYLAKIKELASKISQSENNGDYPENLDTKAKQALYDKLDQDEVLALALDSVIQSTKLDGWRDGGIKEKKLRIAVGRLIKDEERTKELMEIIKAQGEY